MGKESVDVMVEGGKATAAPPLGPALGPLKVNIGEVVAEINKKTDSFKGMQVPVKVTVDTDTKEFKITIGTPPASALLKKEAGIKKGSGNPAVDKVADLKIEQIIKVAMQKEDNLLGATMKAKVKEIIGSCNGLGILVEGKPAKEAMQLVEADTFKAQIDARKTEITEEEKKKLEEERKRMEQEMKEKRDQFLKEANAIVAKMEGKEIKAIRKALEEAKIPMPIINEVAPEEKEKK